MVLVRFHLRRDSTPRRVLLIVSALILIAPWTLSLRAQGPPRILGQWIVPPGPPQVVPFNGREAVANEVLVKFRTLTLGRVSDAVTDYDIGAYKAIGRGEVVRMRSRSRSAESLVASLSARADVEYAEPNYVVQADQISVEQVSNDPGFGTQWALRNLGGPIMGVNGTYDADIDADLAWDVSTGSEAVVVGVLDSGIDLGHPDLLANIWSAPVAFSVIIGGQSIQCSAGTHGYNAITSTCDPQDDRGHGTLVAGIVGAVGDNGVGVAGVNWATSLMALKVIAEDGFGTTADAVDAIEFAIQTRLFFSFENSADVRILSASWGGADLSLALRDQVEAASDAGMLFVAAAGNQGADTDTAPHYPSGFDVPGVISVAASDNRDELADFSNYGLETVDLAAPGVWVLSTLWTEDGPAYALASGTSMAAPYVSGVAALIVAACGTPPGELGDLILETVDPIDSLEGKMRTGGRLNAANALNLCRQPTFTMHVEPQYVQVVRGESAEFGVEIRAWSGFNNNVTFHVYDAQGAFQPTNVLGSGNAVLTIDTTFLDIGSNEITVIATNGVVERRVEIVLETTATPATPIPVSCPSITAGVLTATDPYSVIRPGVFHHRYSVQVLEPGDLSVSIDSRDFFPWVTLLDSNGALIHHGYPTVRDQVMPGIYLIEASSMAPGDVGAYSLMLSCPGDPVRREEVVVDFGQPYGIWIWKNDTEWVQLHHASPESMLVGDLEGSTWGEVIVDFGEPYGIWTWINDSYWIEAHPDSPEEMILNTPFSSDGREEIIADFGADGIRNGNGRGSWGLITDLQSQAMVSGDLFDDEWDSLVFDFGQPYGLRVWRYWFGGIGLLLHNLSPESMAVGEFNVNGKDELVLDFGEPYGIWKWEEGIAWVQLHNYSPLEPMIVGDIDGNGQSDLIADFGSPYGIYVWKNNSAWVQLHHVSQQKMVTGDVDGDGRDDVIVDFGQPYGIYIWKNDSEWVQLHHMSPRSMTTGNIDGF